MALPHAPYPKHSTSWGLTHEAQKQLESVSYHLLDVPFEQSDVVQAHCTSHPARITHVWYQPRLSFADSLHRAPTPPYACVVQSHLVQSWQHPYDVAGDRKPSSWFSVACLAFGILIWPSRLLPKHVRKLSVLNPHVCSYPADTYEYLIALTTDVCRMDGTLPCRILLLPQHHIEPPGVAAHVSSSLQSAHACNPPTDTWLNLPSGGSACPDLSWSCSSCVRSLDPKH
mmetsp:Transcript_15551/g.35839  ORF Transcript_15551/g.35839 Transcript_15551/m.35839 type:complete len:228 (-) Transcript_15551:745-1428(-)